MSPNLELIVVPASPALLGDPRPVADFSVTSRAAGNEKEPLFIPCLINQGVGNLGLLPGAGFEICKSCKTSLSHQSQGPCSNMLLHWSPGLCFRALGWVSDD